MDLSKWHFDTIFLNKSVAFINVPICLSASRVNARNLLATHLAFFHLCGLNLDKTMAELLLTDLSRIFFNKDLKPIVRVQRKSLSNFRATTSISADGCVVMQINSNMAALPGLSSEETMVSVLLRELCVAFLHASHQDGKAFTWFDAREEMIGSTGYGLAWLRLAAAVQARAPRLLGLSAVNLELVRWTRYEFIRSGVRPSKKHVEEIFGGVDPICESVEHRRAEVARKA